jgi:hypothetical protein
VQPEIQQRPSVCRLSWKLLCRVSSNRPIKRRNEFTQPEWPSETTRTELDKLSRRNSVPDFKTLRRTIRCRYDVHDRQTEKHEKGHGLHTEGSFLTSSRTPKMPTRFYWRRFVDRA